jgi:hypothetical protein
MCARSFVKGVTIILGEGASERPLAIIPCSGLVSAVISFRSDPPLDCGWNATSNITIADYACFLGYAQLLLAQQITMGVAGAVSIVPHNLASRVDPIRL